MSKQFTLGKQERLKSRKAIDLLFKEGKRFTIAPYRIFYHPAETTGLMAGAGASARNFKKAVDRNRIKRLTREAWRLQKEPLKQVLQLQQKGLHVFLIYTEKELPDYGQVYDSIAQVLQKLIKLVEK